MKNNYLKLFTAFCFILFFFSCGTPLKTERPEISYEVFEASVAESYMNIPVQINLYNLSVDANSEIPQQLYKKDSIDVGSNVKIDLDIKRRGKISITTSNGNINTSIPIHVQGKASFSAKACGICPRIEHSQPFDADLTIITSTKLAIVNQWNIKTQTNADFLLDKAPCINFIGISICFASLTRENLKKLLPQINSFVDEKINKTYNLKTEAEKYWEQFTKPMQILNNPVNIWIVFQPTNFNFAPPVSVDYNNILLTLGLKSKIKTIVGEKPEFVDSSPLPAIQNVPAKDNQFEINLPIAIDLKEVNKITKQELAGKTFTIPSLKRDVKIRDIDVIGSGKTLIIRTNIESKKIKGYIYILADPLFDDSTRCLKVENLHFDAKTNNVLANKADWLLNSFFTKSIQKKIVFNLGKNIDDMRSQLEKSVSALPLNNRVTLKADIHNFTIQEISFNPGYAFLNVRVSGGLEVNVK
jgi:uncharacterized protein YpmS